MKRTFLLIYGFLELLIKFKTFQDGQTMTHAYSVLLMNLMNWPIYF